MFSFEILSTKPLRHSREVSYMNKTQGMNKKQSEGISKDIPIVAMVVALVWLAFLLSQHRSVFPDNWFPSHFAASTFMVLFYAWVLSEITNNMWSKKNSQVTNQDKGSYKINIVTSWIALFIVFVLRGLGIGMFSGNLQYIGFILLAFGIMLRELSIWVLGKHFTVRVQVSEKAKLVTQGPYRYIRHPSYTGILLTFVGIPLAIGTWFGAIVAVVAKLLALQYRIRIEEEALQAAFGAEYEEYKKSTWKLFPGF